LTAEPVARPAPQRWRTRWHAARRRFAHSIRWRLVTLFLLLALASAAVFLFGTQRILQAGWQTWARPLVADYIDRLAADIGNPPDAARAAALAARLPIIVRIDGPQVQFDSDPGRRRYDGWDSAHRGAAPGDWGLVRDTADGHRIRFGLAWLPDPERPRRLGWYTLAALLLLTGGAYVVVHRLLRPLGPIGDGVARFGRGDFAQPIALRRRDELGDLAERINGMAHSLHGMLQDKQALLLAISHELRSPLTRARLNAELVDDGPSKDALLRDLAEMRDLISSLLEGERIAAGAGALQLETVDLVALVHEVADAAERAAPRTDDASPHPGRLTFDLTAPSPVVRADATRVKLLLRNLIDNARRHGAESTAPPQVFLRRESDGALALGVRDFGPGVPAALLPRLAEAFYRPDSARTRATGGVGLGLYLCRLVAQAHGGKLRITPAEPGLEVAMVWRPPAA
jgi:signal transduction histidine kinase